MHHPRMSIATGICVAVLFAFAMPGFAQDKPAGAHFIRAFVIDERLSALRQAADVHAPVLKRLRIGRTVYLTSSTSARSEYFRVAVTRRTRGWIHQSAIALPGRAGEDERVMQVIEETGDGLDRIALCQLFLERFSRSRLQPRALLLLGEEAGRAAAALTQHARRRLKTLDEQQPGATVEAYYLNDPGLDRYSRLRIAFRFDAAQTRYAYDGKAYRDIIRRYPQSAEAEIARRRIEKPDAPLAKEK
ncbi:MAG: hypothetical protein V7641_3436 [Blastocatellia bacterium]